MIQELENERLTSTSWLEDNLGSPPIRIVKIAGLREEMLEEI